MAGAAVHVENIRLTASNESGGAFSSLVRDISNASGVARGLQGALGAIGIGLSAGGIAQFAREAIKSLGDIAGAADRVGTSTDALQTLRFELSKSGGDAATAEQALGRFAKTAAQAGIEENYLNKVLKANNVELKDRAGNLRTSDALLEDYARLVANASSQQEKLFLTGEAFGDKAGPKMVATMEAIARNGLPAMIAMAKEAGQVVEEGLVRKADEVDQQWNAAISSVTNKLKGFVVEVINAKEAFDKFVGDRTRTVSPMAGTMDAEGFMVGTDVTVAPAPSAIDLNREAMANASPALAGSVPLPRSRPATGRPTVLPPKSTPAAEKRDAFERGQDDVRKRIALNEADTRTIGMNSEARERARTVALLEEAAQRANRDAKMANTAVTEQQRQAIEALADQMAESEARQRRLKDAWQGLNDTIRHGADIAMDAFDTMMDKTKSWADFAISSAKNVARELMRAALTGEGAFAKLLGFNSSNGGAGGAMGAFASFLRSAFTPGGGAGFGGSAVDSFGNNTLAFGGPRAGGGSVSAGVRYWVGEEGPEEFVPNAPGAIVPNGGGGTTVNVINNTGVQASARQNTNADGSIDVYLDKMEGRAADNVMRGRGPMAKVLPRGPLRG